MHRCIVCNTRPAEDVDAAFCGDACATAWEQNARDALARIQRLCEAEARAEKVLGREMAALAINAHDEAAATGLWN
jgi:hypothetical protein